MVSGVLNKSGEVRVVRLKPRRRQTAGLSVHCAEGETKGSERSPSPGVAGGAWMLQSLEVSQAGEAGAAHHAVSWRRSGRDRGAGAGEEDGWVHCLLQPRDKAQKGNQVMEGAPLRVTELESDRSGPRVCAPDPHGGRGWGWRCGCCQPEAPSGGEPPGKRGPESPGRRFRLQPWRLGVSRGEGRRLVCEVRGAAGQG